MAEQPYDSTQARFDVLRKRLQSQKSQAQSEQEEAIKRRYAAQGMLNSGAYQKSQEETALKLEQQQQQGLEDISAQEDAEKQRLAEVKQAREYQTSEREAGQKYATGEREAGQAFAAGQAKQQQLFSKELFDADMDFKRMVQSQNFDLASKEFEESKKSNLANLAIALKTSGMNDYDVEQLFSKAGQILGAGGNSTFTPQQSSTRDQVAGGINSLVNQGRHEEARFLQEILRGYGYDTAMQELQKIQGGRNPTQNSFNQLLFRG